jgi:hypothetical protein
MSFQFSGGGYRHFIRSRHNVGANNGNGIDFFLNSTAVSTASTAPGTGNVLGATITPVGVGILTSTPQTALDVSGTISSTNLSVAGTISATNTYVVSNVGVRTTNPQGPLDISVAGNNSTFGAYIRVPLYTRIPISNVATSTLTVASSGYGTYYSLENPLFSNITLPASTVSADGGAFWLLRNNTGTYMSITVTNTLTLTSPLALPPGNNATIVVSTISNNTVLLF